MIDDVPFPTRYLIYDFETTGLDTQACDVIEIGAMQVDNKNVLAKKTWLIRIPTPLPEKIIEITGITDDLLQKEGVEESQAFKEFAEFAKDFTLVGHNIIRFDNPILRRKATLHGVIDHLDQGMTKCYDTAGMFKASVLGRNKYESETYQEFCLRVMEERVRVKFNLSYACEELGFDCSTVTAHRAGGDVEMVKFVYEKLTNV